MKFFSVDGPLYKFLSKLWIALKLNFCWVLFSLPIITIGASTVAAYSVGLKVVRDEEGHIFRSFAKAFKDNFVQGTIAWIINVFALFAIYYDFQLSGAVESELLQGVFFSFGIIGVFFLVLGMLYTYPLLARYENKLIPTIVNSIRISFQFIVGTLVVLILVAVEVCIFLWTTTLWFFGIILGPAVIILTISYYARNCFGIIELDPENIKEAKKMKKRKNTDFDPETSGSEYTPVYDDSHILIMPDYEDEGLGEEEKADCEADTEESADEDNTDTSDGEDN